MIKNHNADYMVVAARPVQAIAWISLMLGISVALAIILLNRSLEHDRRQFDSDQEWLEDLSMISSRYYSFVERRPSFYSDLLYSSLREGCWDESEPVYVEGPLIGTRLYMPPLGGFAFTRQLHGPGRLKSNPLPRTLSFRSELLIFGERAKLLFEKVVNHDVRGIELDALADETISDPSVVSFFHRCRIAKSMQDIDDPKSRRRLASWLIGDDWIKFSGGGIRTGDRLFEFSVSYQDRFVLPTRIGAHYRDKNALLAIFANEGPTKAFESKLKDLLDQASDRFYGRDPASQLPGVPVWGGGITADVGALLMVAAPFLAFFHCVFLIYWRRFTYVTQQQQLESTMVFPQFHSPSDPFAGPPPHNFEDYVHRGIWGAFLSIPILLISIGALTRYDIHALTLDWSSQFAYRSAAPGSLALDLFCLGSLAVSLQVVMVIVTGSQGTQSLAGRRSNLYIRWTLCTALLLFPFLLNIVGAGVRGSRLNGLFPQAEELPLLLPYVGYGLLWVYFLAKSIANRVWLTTLISVFGYLSYALYA